MSSKLEKALNSKLGLIQLVPTLLISLNLPKSSVLFVLKLNKRSIVNLVLVLDSIFFVVNLLVDYVHVKPVLIINGNAVRYFST